MEPCPHWTARVETGAWTLEVEGEYAGLWVHGAADCRKPSQATLDRRRSQTAEVRVVVADFPIEES